MSVTAQQRSHVNDTLKTIILDNLKEVESSLAVDLPGLQALTHTMDTAAQLLNWVNHRQVLEAAGVAIPSMTPTNLTTAIQLAKDLLHEDRYTLEMYRLIIDVLIEEAIG